MSRLNNRVATIHEAETEHYRRLWERFTERAFGGLTDEIIDAYLELQDLPQDVADEVVAEHTGGLWQPVATEPWMTWTAHLCEVMGDGESVPLHGPEVLTEPPPEPDGVFADALERAENASRETVMGVSWVLIILGLARAAREPKLEMP